MRLHSIRVRSSHLFLCLAGTAVVATTAIVSAKSVPDNLGNGLNKIVENQLLQEGKISVPSQNLSNVSNKNVATKTTARDQASYIAAYKAAVARAAAKADAMAITDRAAGKYLVDIMPNGTVSVTSLQATLQSQFPALKVQAVDKKYAGHGVIEADVTSDDAAGIAKLSGVRSVILQLRPMHSVGAVTSQGVNQHRVNRISTLYNASAAVNFDGTGMSIGVMSDSFDSEPSAEGGFTTATADVATQDLPGTGNLTNSQPVVVLQDFSNPPNATNEGRGMCQIVADIAPKARIGFASADVGEVGFANNIRALGGLNGFTYANNIQQGFKGDVVCDDVSYLDEPMFQDGIIAQGVIDVVNAKVTYCSSAANNWGTDGYASTFRPVANGAGLTAATNSALVGTNINLTGVDPALYAGGFHNFNPAAGQQDVAQLFNSESDPQAAVFQWNDAYDTSVPALGPIVFGPVTGDSEGGGSVDYQVNLTAGQEYVITEMATPQTPAENFDAIVAVIDPSSKTIIDQDTGVDETVVIFAPVTGTYTIHVHPFATTPPVIGGPIDVPTQGHFSLQVNTASGVSRITQDFNLLFFKTDGTFIEAVASNNFANNRPYEVWVPDLSATASQVQLVICRSNSTAPANAANQLKYVFFGNGATGMGPAEYNNYLSPVTFGHSAVAGANSVAAYAMFRPNLPEDFTSPGPVTIYFDTNNNRLTTPQVRLKPDIAAADGANNTFFPLGPGNDYPFDPDSFPNFYGTSAASPHSAAIAALIIQAHGGSGSLTPAQVKTIMQLNAFPHDLDPYSVSGSASAHGGTVSINVVGDNDANTGTGANNPNSWTVTYTGPGYVKDLHFNPEGTAQTGGNVTGGNFNGFTPADFLDSTKYKYTPGMVFNTNQYTAGTQSDVVAATHTFTNAAPLPSTNAFFWTLNLTFPTNTFINGKAFRFNVGRNQQQDATTPQGMTIPNVLFGQPNQYSADILGSGVLIPEYADNPIIMSGMTFSGTITDGGTDFPFSGRLVNKVGHGYSPLDGYGFINAQAAVSGVVPTPGVVSRKVHGGITTPFDIPLPSAGNAGVECRSPQANNSHQLVYTFDKAVGSAGTALVTQGTGVAGTPTLGPEPNQVTVTVTGVTNAQHLIVTLSNVTDSSGGVFAAVPARMDVLLGDTNANRSVNSSDVSQTKSNSGKAVDTTDFRTDVNANGAINSSDVSLVKSSSGTALP